MEKEKNVKFIKIRIKIEYHIQLNPFKIYMEMNIRFFAILIIG